MTWDAAFLTQYEGVVRFSIFAAAFLILVVAEAFRPDNPRHLTRSQRWPANLGLGLISSLALRVLLPGAAVLAAVFAQMRGWGALNWTDWPLWVEVLAAVIMLDLGIYAQHIATHRTPILWRLHQVHHADREIDVTTALRFHPVEIVLSQTYKIALVVALGVHPIAVIIFEILLNACAMFNHANIRLGRVPDAILRLVLVTPDMHRIHHSERPDETNANFGFSLSLWDRLFGTYRAAAQSPLVIGLEPLRAAPANQLLWMLMSPFRSRAL